MEWYCVRTGLSSRFMFLARLLGFTKLEMNRSEVWKAWWIDTLCVSCPPEQATPRRGSITAEVNGRSTTY